MIEASALRTAVSFGVLVLALALASADSLPTAAEAACPDGNVVEQARLLTAYDAYHTERLTDGIVSPEGEHWLSDRNALFTAVGYLVYELPQTTRINSLFLQADSNDSYRVSGSIDGERWQLLGEVPAVEGPGVRMRYATEFDLELRYLRIEPGRGDGDFSIGEFAAYCGVPDPWPPLLEIRSGTVRDAAWARTRERRLAVGKIAVGLVGGLILFMIARSGRRESGGPVWIRRTALVAVVLAGAFSWINFGTFHGQNLVHHHEMFHYVLGSKYFEENRYSLLYRCTETAEAETGRRAFVERRVIRNLSTNRLEPARQVLADPTVCRDAFSDARWDEFKRDVEFFRSNDYPGSWGAIFRDHGYNATPVWNMAGGWLANRDSLSRRPAVLAAIDFLLYGGLFALILWAFGLEVCALSALIWGVGLPWQYYWTGGAYARVPWLFLAVAAVCLMRRSRFGMGGLALTGSALLRLFPLLLGVGPVMLCLRDAVRTRRLGAFCIRGLTGALLAVGILLPLSAWSAGGVGVWSDFFHNIRKHSDSPLGNHVGLPTLFAWDASNTQSEVLTGRLKDFDDWERGRHAVFAARRPLYLGAALAVLALFTVFVLRYSRAEWETVSSGTLLVFAFTELASYYLVFFVLLAPFASRRPLRVALLVAAVVLSQVTQFADLSVDTLFFVQSLLFLIFSVAIVADLIRRRRLAREQSD